LIIKCLRSHFFQEHKLLSCSLKGSHRMTHSSLNTRISAVFSWSAVVVPGVVNVQMGLGLAKIIQIIQYLVS
jgi:hypothetical protein